MGRNKSIKSVGQVVRLCVLSATLIISVSFNVSQASGQVSSSSNSTVGGDQCQLEASFAGPTNVSGASDEIDSSLQARIGGDGFASYSQFPFHVGIYVDDEYTCGGALIDDHHIITAKQCSRFALARISVILGDLNRSQPDGEKFREVRRIESHPNTELAILFIDPIRLERSCNTGRGAVNSIVLPTGPQSIQGDVIVTGWGSETTNGPFSDILKYATVSVSRCRTPIQGYFCSRQNWMGPCRGDVGGPAFKPLSKGGFLLFGIIVGSSCIDECNDPECDWEYIDISQHLRWINRFE